MKLESGVFLLKNNMTQSILIDLDGKPHVVLNQAPKYQLTEKILDYYSENYGYDRKRLTGQWIDNIEYDLGEHSHLDDGRQAILI